MKNNIQQVLKICISSTILPILFSLTTSCRTPDPKELHTLNENESKLNRNSNKTAKKNENSNFYSLFSDSVPKEGRKFEVKTEKSDLNGLKSQSETISGFDYIAIPQYMIKLPQNISDAFNRSEHLIFAVEKSSFSSSDSEQPKLRLFPNFTKKFFENLQWEYTRKIVKDPNGPGLLSDNHQLIGDGFKINDATGVVSENKYLNGFEGQVFQDIHRYPVKVESKGILFPSKKTVVVEAGDPLRASLFRKEIHDTVSTQFPEVPSKDLNQRISLAMHYSTQTFDGGLTESILAGVAPKKKGNWAYWARHHKNSVNYHIHGDILTVRKNFVFGIADENAVFLKSDLVYAQRELSINLRTGDISPEKSKVIWENIALKSAVKSAFAAIATVGLGALVVAGFLLRDNIRNKFKGEPDSGNHKTPKDFQSLEDNYALKPRLLNLNGAKGYLIDPLTKKPDSGMWIELNFSSLKAIQFIPNSAN